MFIDLQGVLEGGEFYIQNELLALYLPPGCIHSTITLRGGLAPGITFTTAECLGPSALIWDLDYKTVKTDKYDCVCFVRAVAIIMRSGDQAKKQEALSKLCDRYKKISKLRPDGWSEVRKYLPKQCSQCGKQWGKH